MILEEYGFTPSLIPINTQGMPARVTAVRKQRFELVCEEGTCFAQVKSSAFYWGDQPFPTVGDFVLIQFNPLGDSLILETLPRKTFFSRKDPDANKGEQAVAANFDYVFIMQSLNMDFNPARLERYLTLSWQSGALPVILLTKADLTKDYAYYLHEIAAIAPGVDTHIISAHTGQGLDALTTYLQPGKTCVFLGSSGVGKSSLVNALAGQQLMAVNAIREDDSKGRHTTTHRQLFFLESGAMVIDTPGMRQLGMWDASEGLGNAFADVEQFLGQCRFADCQHQSEPGCAIQQAIANGMLSRQRWESYCRLKKEALYADDKAAFMRQKQQWHKNIIKYAKQKKKEI